ncbi:MAG: methylmalonyl Co-A mutase-associated GTPase MeaB, partial [Desulfatitalea sp.]|nr:methylmalonyl Co-A mutase-associated GTPase MeaB [Desulfatitalea sp.]
SEAAVAAMVDFFLLLMITGAGDALQGIKKGILEMAHAVAINKADGDNLQRAEKMRQELEGALHLMHPTTATWTPPVVTCSAITRTGLDALWELIRTHRQRLRASGEMEERRRDQALQWMWSMIEDGLKERFNQHPQVRQQLPQMTAAVRGGRTTATHAARKLLFMLDKDCGDKKGM